MLQSIQSSTPKSIIQANNSKETLRMIEVGKFRIERQPLTIGVFVDITVMGECQPHGLTMALKSEDGFEEIAIIVGQLTETIIEKTIAFCQDYA